MMIDVGSTPTGVHLLEADVRNRLLPRVCLEEGCKVQITSSWDVEGIWVYHGSELKIFQVSVTKSQQESLEEVQQWLISHHHPEWVMDPAHS